MSTRFLIQGVVREKESGVGIGNLMVKAYDKDLLFDDLLGNAFTTVDGSFEIVCEAEDFRDFFEAAPDIYLRVLSADASREIFTTERSVRWQAGRVERFAVEVPAAVLGDLLPRPTATLTDEVGEERAEFDAGESLILDTEGLKPTHVYDVAVRTEQGEPVAESRVISDTAGRLPRVIPWPQLGLGGEGDFSFPTPEAAEAELAGRGFTIRVADGSRVVLERPFRFASAFRRPLLYSADSDGHVLNGFEHGQAEVAIRGRNLPAESTVRVFAVNRQFDWHIGDPIEPVVLADGRPAIADVETDSRGSFYVRLGASDEFGPGSYQFIARVYRPGFLDADSLTVLPGEVVSSRRLASLVIRRDFWAVKAVRGGCAMSQDMAGRPISGRPYFQFANSFQVGEDVWAALDPAGLDPGLIGKKVALYVIQDKTAAQWSADTDLQHLPALGGNPAVQEFITQPSCINYNDVLVWPNAAIPGKYELVADFGNNPPTPATFARDDSFDTPLDVIDGYFKVGFHVVEDPTTTAPFPHAGTFEYNEGTTTVPAPGEVTNPATLEQKAVVYFPASVAGATNPSQISATQAQYPLVVVVHGNSGNLNSYKGYNYLLEHLARNGFIAASIHTYINAYMEPRARALFKHIEILKTKFPGKIDLSNVGIMGHSRGGEGVVLASKLNVDEALGYNFKAIISLAPTDWYDYALVGSYHVPYLVIYGANDGDVAGGGTSTVSPRSTGFALYDRADPIRAMLFVEGATHGRFNTEWGDTDITASWSKVHSSDLPKLITADAHAKIAKGYMNAFFLWHLYGRSELADFFTGELMPTQVQTADGGTVRIHAQYQPPAHVVLDRFNNANWQLNDLGGTVSHTGTLPVNPTEGDLFTLDSFSPHDTNGGVIRWDGSSDVYVSDFTATDISAYEFLSFRVTQRYGSASNPAAATQDLYVKLTDGGGNSRSLLASKFEVVPYPYVRGYNHLTKSALKTVRIPLAAYRIEVVGTQKVDLTNVTSVSFEFAAKPGGELDIDDLEFCS